MTKMKNLGWKQCHCEPSSYCHCEPFSTVIASPRSGRGNLGGARLCSLPQDCFVAIAPRNDREGFLRAECVAISW